MRTIIELPDDQIDALKALAARDQVSRAELIRRAVAEYLSSHPLDTEARKAAFGLWRDRGDRDGVAYQRKLRSDWEGRGEGPL